MVACLHYHWGGTSSVHRKAAHFVFPPWSPAFFSLAPFPSSGFQFLVPIKLQTFSYIALFRIALWLKQYGIHVSILCSFCILKASFLPRSCHIVPELQYRALVRRDSRLYLTHTGLPRQKCLQSGTSADQDRVKCVNVSAHVANLSSLCLLRFLQTWGTVPTFHPPLWLWHIAGGSLERRYEAGVHQLLPQEGRVENKISTIPNQAELVAHNSLSFPGAAMSLQTF